MSNHSDLFLSKLTHRCYWDFQIKVNVFNSLLFKVFLVDIFYQCKGFFFQLQLWGLVFIVVCLICFGFGYQVLNSGQTPHYWAASNDILSLWKEFPSSLELTFEVQSVLKFMILLSYPLKFLGSQASGVCWLIGWFGTESQFGLKLVTFLLCLLRSYGQRFESPCQITNADLYIKTKKW